MAQAKVEPFVRIDVQTKRGSGVAFQLLTSIASALMCTPMPIIQLTSRSLMATPHGRFLKFGFGGQVMSKFKSVWQTELLNLR